MVADTDSQTSGYRARMSADTVPFPTAVGPASTVNRRDRLVPPSVTHRSAGEALDERSDLVRPQAAHPPRLGDADLFHDLPGPHLADSRDGLEQS